MSEVGRIRISSKAGVKVHFENPGQEGGDAATLCGQGADYISPTTDTADCARCVKAHAKLVVAAADEVTVTAGLARVAAKAKREQAAEALLAAEAALTDTEPVTATCGRCHRSLVWVHGMWIGHNGEEMCPNGVDRHVPGVDVTDTVLEPLAGLAVVDVTAEVVTLPVRKRAHQRHDDYVASIVIAWTCGMCGPRDRMGCGACVPADEQGFPIIDLVTLAQRWMDLFTSVANHPDVDVARSESWQYREAFTRAATAIDNAYTYVDMDDIMAMVAEDGVTVAEAAKRVYEAEFPLMCQEQTYTPCEYRTDTVSAMRYHVQRAHGDDTSALWLDTLEAAQQAATCGGCGSDGETHDADCWVAGPPVAAEPLQAAPSKIIEALPPTGSRHGDHVRDYAIGYVPRYRGHWSGVAWVSHHGYGVQVHRTLPDARNWAAGRVRIFGADDLIAAPIPPMVLTRRKASKGRGNRGW